MTPDIAPMVSQLKVTGLPPSSQSSVIRHPLLQTIEGTVQVFTAVHRSFFHQRHGAGSAHCRAGQVGADCAVSEGAAFTRGQINPCSLAKI